MENKQAQETTKSDLVTAPSIHTSRWVKTRLTGLGSINTYRFPQDQAVQRVAKYWETSYLNHSTEGGKWWKAVFKSCNTAIPKSYCTAGQIHWKLPWSHDSHQEVNLKEQTIHRGRGGDMHNPTVCLLSSSSLSFTSPCVTSSWALVKMF